MNRRPRLLRIEFGALRFVWWWRRRVLRNIPSFLCLESCLTSSVSSSVSCSFCHSLQLESKESKLVPLGPREPIMLERCPRHTTLPRCSMLRREMNGAHHCILVLPLDIFPSSSELCLRLLSRSESTQVTKSIDSAEQNLQRPESRSRSILRKLMSRPLNRVERKSPFSPPLTQNTRSTIPIRKLRHNERVAGIFLKPLLAVPGDVLEGQERAVGREYGVEISGSNLYVVCVFNDTGQDVVLRWSQAGIVGAFVIVGATEDIGYGANAPSPVGANRCVDCALDIFSSEIGLWIVWSSFSASQAISISIFLALKIIFATHPSGAALMTS